MSNQNFRLMMVATLPLDEPMRSNRPKRTMAQVYERPAYKNRSKRLDRIAAKHGEDQS